MSPEVTAAVQRLTAASRTPGRVIIRLDDLIAVLRLVEDLNEERDVLGQIINRDRQAHAGDRFPVGLAGLTSLSPDCAALPAAVSALWLRHGVVVTDTDDALPLKGGPPCRHLSALAYVVRHSGREEQPG